MEPWSVIRTRLLTDRAPRTDPRWKIPFQVRAIGRYRHHAEKSYYREFLRRLERRLTGIRTLEYFIGVAHLEAVSPMLTP
jgi:hypothetical protein